MHEVHGTALSCSALYHLALYHLVRYHVGLYHLGVYHVEHSIVIAVRHGACGAWWR